MGSLNAQAGNRRLVTIAVFVATFLAAIEGTIVGTAMPKITSDLSGLGQYSWVISVYLLCTVISTPVYGKLSDLYGRKRIFLISAVVFLAGSMLSGLAQNMDQLIWFRALQGLGAGGMITIPATIVGDLYNFEERGKVQGWLSSVWGIAGITGPVLGGLLVDYLSWRAIFYMNLPFGIAAIALFSISLKENFAPKKPTIDYGGILTFSAGMISFLYAMELLQMDKPASMLTFGICLAVSFICFVLFFVIEQRAAQPFIPLRLLAERTILTANLISFLVCVLNVIVIFYLPLWLQGVQGKSATASGLLMIPLSISWPLGSIIGGTMLAKLGLRLIGLSAAGLLMVGCAGLAMMSSDVSIVWFISCMFICGLSFGLSSTSLTVTIQSSVGWENRGAAMSSFNLIRTLGQTLGISLFGLMLYTGTANEIDAGLLYESLHFIFLVSTALSLLVLLVTLRLPKQVKVEESSS